MPAPTVLEVFRRAIPKQLADARIYRVIWLKDGKFEASTEVASKTAACRVADDFGKRSMRDPNRASYAIRVEYR